ncbi:AAA family ATPase [Streptomyces sp. NBC_01803]|nr:AAA family ATPase [Streptomyces sp. NBC_01803]
MCLVEREHELSALSDMLTKCGRGSGGAALITGGIGCGKTALLTELGRRAAEDGFLVLGAVGSWAERRSRGGVLGQVFRQAEIRPGDGDALTGLLDRLNGPPADPDGTAPGLGPRPLDAGTAAALHRLCAEVARIAERTPLLLCVDDVQFTDPLSAHWLLLLSRRLPAARIVLVMTECTLSRPAHPGLHAELLRQPGYHRLPLRRLSRQGVTALLSEVLGADTARTLAADCHAVSGGNPLFVRALAADSGHRADDPGAAAPELVVADGYRDAVAGCLHRGLPTLLRLAQALAVLDEGTPGGRGDGPHPVGRLAEVDAATLRRGMHALDSAGLLDGGRLRHPVARAAALDSLTGPERSALHRRAAELLYEEGAPATAIARHLLAVGPFAGPGPLPWAVALLREAAERQLAANRPAEAQACLEAALRACDDDAERLRLKALLAGTAWVLNPSVSARHLGELAGALRDGRLPDRHALMLAKYLMWHGCFDEAADAVERIGRSGAEHDPVTAAEARATRELLSATYPALVPRTAGPEGAGGPRLVRPARSERPRGPAPGDPRARGAAALSRVLRHGPDQDAVAAAEAAMRAMLLGKNTHEWLTCAVSALLFADRITAAADWCDHWLEEARNRRVPLWVAEFSSLRAGIALRQGEPVRARELAETALTRLSAESWGVCVGGPLANLIQAATDVGDHQAAAGYLDIPVPPGTFRSRFGLYYLYARGNYYLETAQPHAALDDFTTCATLMRQWGFDQPALIPWRSGAARAQRALGDTAQAYALAREQLVRAGEEQSRTRGISLRTLAAASRPAQRTALLTKAVAVLEASGDRLQLAGALADLGEAQARAGHPARARALVERAADLAERSGALPLAAELRTAPAAASGPPAWGRFPAVSPGPGADAAARLLTAAERRVAELAARGHTNRQISERLGITVSTVEQHLTRIFRKLGVRTRAELSMPDTHRAAAG